MTIKEIIEQLEKMDEKEKDLPLYVCDEDGNNYPVKSISLYDSCASHSKENPLGADFSKNVDVEFCLN